MIRRARRSTGALLVLLTICPMGVSLAQDTLVRPPIHDFTPVEGWTPRKVAATTLVGSLFAITWVDAYFTWWKDAEKPFTFWTDNGWPWVPNSSFRGVDKVGHFFGTYSVFKMANCLLLWGGYSRSAAFWWAAGYGLLNGLQIEIGDGFTPYGFDWKDLTTDFLGVGYAMLQSEVPFFENFNLKFSYWSRTGVKTPIEFTKDYDAMTIWTSLNMHNLLPGSVGDSWPKWLNLAVGYGVDDHESRREFVIGLDFNFEGLSTSSEDWLVAERLGNLWHAPAPTIKWIPGREPQYYMMHLR